MALLPDRIFKVPKRFNPYHRAHEGRVGIDHPHMTRIRKPFFKALIATFMLLQVVFFGLFCYMFGALYQQTTYVNSMQIEFIDYDGGVIGQSFRSAYRQLESPGFPTLVETSAIGSTPDIGLMTNQVCQLDSWATIWIEPGASQRLAAALSGGQAAATYNPSDVVAYIWNEARYATTNDALIVSNINALSNAARAVYSRTNGTAALNIISAAGTDPAAVNAYSNPWTLRAIDIKPTPQGSRAIYNTLCVILVIIQQFFYLSAINGMYSAFKVYDKLHPHRLILFRLAISLFFTFIGALCVTGSIWIFKNGWQVNGVQFVLTWMVLWLFAHVNFLVLDALTVWIDMKFVPFFLGAWLIFNVASILAPFDLMPGFYKWGYALPAHALYNVEMDIWSSGCNPRLYIDLPVLFSWWVLGLILTGIGMHRRAHFAVIEKEEEQAAFDDRLTEALAFEKKRDLEIKLEAAAEKRKLQQQSSEEAEDSSGAEREKEDREEMEAELRKIESRKRMLAMSRTRSAANYGPSFMVPFGSVPREDV